jgi:hypothetical protein
MAKQGSKEGVGNWAVQQASKATPSTCSYLGRYMKGGQASQKTWSFPLSQHVSLFEILLNN